MSIATEIVTMKTVEDVDSAVFQSLVNDLEINFHSKQPGFIDTELLYNDKANEWIMVQHWDSLDNMRAASKRMFDNPVTEPFVKSIDPKNVKMLVLPQLGKWCADTSQV